MRAIEERSGVEVTIVYEGVVRKMRLTWKSCVRNERDMAERRGLGKRDRSCVRRQDDDVTGE